MEDSDKLKLARPVGSGGTVHVRPYIKSSTGGKTVFVRAADRAAGRIAIQAPTVVPPVGKLAKQNAAAERAGQALKNQVAKDAAAVARDAAKIASAQAKSAAAQAKAQAAQTKGAAKVAAAKGAAQAKAIKTAKALVKVQKGSTSKRVANKGVNPKKTIAPKQTKNTSTAKQPKNTSTAKQPKKAAAPKQPKAAKAQYVKHPRPVLHPYTKHPRQAKAQQPKSGKKGSTLKGLGIGSVLGKGLGGGSFPGHGFGGGGMRGGNLRHAMFFMRAFRGLPGHKSSTKPGKNAPKASSSSVHPVSTKQLVSAHRAIVRAEIYRKAHARGIHRTPVNYHERLVVSASNTLENFDSDVFNLQEFLAEEGYEVKASGFIDDETVVALSKFFGLESEEELWFLP